MQGNQGSQEVISQDATSERHLWLAVVVQAVEEWRGGSLRSRRKAQEFLFEDSNDFPMVCANAGLDPDGLRSRLRKIGRMVTAQGAWSNLITA
jgi:hypothetical protein